MNQRFPIPRELLSEYFGPVQHLSGKMEKQIKFVLRRTLNTVQREPKVRFSKQVQIYCNIT